MTAILGLGAVIVWCVFGNLCGPGLPTGYVGRDGPYDVYCGYRPNGTNSSEYECTRELATKLPRNQHP